MTKGDYNQPTPIHKPTFDWIADPTKQAQIQQAWQDYKRELTTEKLNQYYALSDKAYIAQNPDVKLTSRTADDGPGPGDQW